MIQAFHARRQAAGSVYPQLIWKTYSMPNETDSTPKADQSVFEALGQSYDPNDLTAFQQQFNLPVQAIKKVVGPNTPSDCRASPNNCAEASLDVQYIMSLAQGAPTWYWSIDQSVQNIFLEFIQEVAKDPAPPQVYSISYGGPEHLQDVPVMNQFNIEVCKMGLRGFTLFVASGDDGVAGYEARGNPSACGFYPEYPANCPYVTTVGATMGPESRNPEITCQSDKGGIITSGGGFSNNFAQPSYQATAVAQYLRTANLPPAGQFNPQGRAYPDVSSLGYNYNVVIGGHTYGLSGTSASTPVFCAMVTLVNGDRETKGKASLGFLNPLLYAIDKSVYNDITVGYNNCAASQSSPTCCPAGFYAAKGWDPLTGYGSIDFNLFADVLASSP